MAATNPRSARFPLWLAGAVLAILIFILITRALLEGEVNALDNAILHAAFKLRTPRLTLSAIDITALGSTPLIALFSAIAFFLLLALRNRLAALQIFVVSTGAPVLTALTKDFIERTRPPEAQQLVVVSGFSYPSGHTLESTAFYVTIAIIADRYVQRPRPRIAIFLSLAIILLFVGTSRVYLAVHYPTDVLSGFSLGAAWALLLAGLFRRLAQPL